MRATIQAEATVLMGPRRGLAPRLSQPSSNIALGGRGLARSIWTAIKAGGAIIGGGMVFAAQNSPGDVMSNYGEWLAFLGVDRVPAWLAAPAVDWWGWYIGLTLLAASLLWAAFPFARRAIIGNGPHSAPAAIRPPARAFIGARDAAAELYQRTRLADRVGIREPAARLRYHAEQILSIAKRRGLALYGRDLPSMELEQITAGDLEFAVWDVGLTGLRPSLHDDEVRWADVQIERQDLEAITTRLKGLGQ